MFWSFLSKVILLARLTRFHCLTNFNPALSCHSQRVNCLWSSAKATNFSSFEKVLHKILKSSFGGWGTSWISCLGNGSGMVWISFFLWKPKKGKVCKNEKFREINMKSNSSTIKQVVQCGNYRTFSVTLDLKVKSKLVNPESLKLISRKIWEW